MTADRKCLVCGGAYHPARSAACSNAAIAGLSRRMFRLSPEELERFTVNRYFHGEEYRDYVSEREIFAKQFRLRLKRLLRYLPPRGAGFCLKSARHMVFSGPGTAAIRPELAASIYPARRPFMRRDVFGCPG